MLFTRDISKIQGRMKIKESKKDMTYKHESKKASVAMLKSEKVDFKAQEITRDKEHFIIDF